VREVAEEVGLHITAPRRLGMFENMFRYANKPEHELVFVYEADCHDESICAQDEVTVTESNGNLFTARWYTPSEIAASGLPLFPEGLLDLLTRTGNNAGTLRVP
jgi:ADP-ribose pyrophosphatase YjhB (NUDIX family)